MGLFNENSICEIVDSLKNKSLTPEEIGQECIAVSERYGQYQFWKSFEEEYIREQLLESKKRLEAGQGKELECIPMGIKDVINTKRYPTQMGSILWEGFRAGNDARIVWDLRYHGAIVAGKTVTSEFSADAINEVLNPYNADKTPGTSSSGSAAAVALGAVPAAIGTQTAGEIIRPASYCGVFGFKPSFGTIARTGILKITDSIDSVGFFTSRADNLKTIFDIIAVKGPNYPYVYKAFHESSRIRRGNRKWKVGFVKTYAWDGAEPYVKKKILSFVEALAKDEEIELKEILLDSIIQNAHEIHRNIYNKLMYYYVQKEQPKQGKVLNATNVMIEEGGKVDDKTFIEALTVQEIKCCEMDYFMEDFDVIITLSTASEAPDRNVPEKEDTALIWSLLHLPALHVPAFKNEISGLPFGVQFVSRRFHDYLLMEFTQYLADKELIPEMVNDFI